MEGFLQNYSLGNFVDFKEIAEGVENTNFKIFTSRGTFILTIFEKRVLSTDLPFFIALMNYLNSKEYKCPKPIASNQDEYILNLKDKPCMIVSFIEGSWVKNIRNTHGWVYYIVTWKTYMSGKCNINIFYFSNRKF